MSDGDPRLAVKIAALPLPPPPGWLVLTEGEAASPVPPFARLPKAAPRRHLRGVVCFCCAPREAAALALTQLLRRLADGGRGEVRGLWIVPESEESGARLSALLSEDPLLAGRLRQVPSENHPPKG
jgi:hypothetical protein